MEYHPLIGILIFIFTIILSFLLGKNAFKKFKDTEKKTKHSFIDSKNKTNYNSPPKGDITSPDAPWLKD